LIYSKEKVIENIEAAPGIFKLKVQGDFQAKPGQFYMLKAWEDGLILPRPISVHDVDEEGISFLYAAAGKGTKILSKLKKNDEIDIMGPLGNGYQVESIKGKVAIVAGGIGIAPMNYLVKSLKGCEIDLFAGFRDCSYSTDEIKGNVNSVNIATETGKIGYRGFVTDLLKPEEYELVICCGPGVMMKKVVDMCIKKQVEVYVSMESRMACGLGACLVCTCKTKEGNKRTCKDGPVFNGKDLAFND
jgi:dihydroorotate dehydrogenase electron transfer subunit